MVEDLVNARDGLGESCQGFTPGFCQHPKDHLSDLFEVAHIVKYHPVVSTLGTTNSLPARGIRVTFSAHGADLDTLVAQARATGGGVVEGPSATPWNTRDVLARDPHGYEVVFASITPVEALDPEFAGRMEQVKRRVLMERAERTTRQN